MTVPGRWEDELDEEDLRKLEALIAGQQRDLAEGDRVLTEKDLIVMDDLSGNNRAVAVHMLATGFGYIRTWP